MTRLRATAMGRVLVFMLMVLTASAHALTCTVAATPVSFGAYSTFDALPLDGTGNVEVTCGNLVNILVSYTISLSSGASGTNIERYMVNGPHQLRYNLYGNSARSTVWGDGGAGSVTLADSYLLLLLSDRRNYSVYGRIPAGQNVAAGTYTDSITITVNY